MTSFSTSRFERLTFERTKGPSEKRRLERRLEERKRRNLGLPSVAPIVPTKPVVTPPTTTPEERKAIRVVRRAKRINRKLRERQRMAARSGLPELVRFGRAGQDAPPRRGRSAKETTTEGFSHNCVSESGTAEECNEVSSDTRQRTPLDVSQEYKLWR